MTPGARVGPKLKNIFKIFISDASSPKKSTYMQGLDTSKNHVRNHPWGDPLG